MLERYIKDQLIAAMNHFPAVALLGPRQVGKTTLSLEIGRQAPSVYLDLESPSDLLKLEDPLSFLGGLSDRLVVLDEFQRAPELFTVLRGLIDKHRQSGKGGNQFLLLGSASMELLRQTSESLAGRILYLEMCGLNLLELPEVNQDEINRLWLRGGFPESYLAADDAASMVWLEMLIRTYLERNVAQVGFRVPAVRLRRLWTMMAHLQGENINYSKLAVNLDVDSKTVTHYLDILVDLLLVRRLQPWYLNAKKRLVKSPRFYIRDSGILHRLLGIQDYHLLLSNPVLGKSWEGFVIENIYSVLPSAIETYYYRSAYGQEIDLLLSFSSDKLWAIEIKHGLTPKISEGFHQAAADVGASRKIVIYGGQESFALDAQTEMMSLMDFLKEISG